jgi:hypothetical protein
VQLMHRSPAKTFAIQFIVMIECPGGRTCGDTRGQVRAIQPVEHRRPVAGSNPFRLG